MSRRTRGLIGALAMAMLAAKDGSATPPKARSSLKLRSGPGRSKWRGKHEQERERRKRQIERGVIRVTPDVVAERKARREAAA